MKENQLRRKKEIEDRVVAIDDILGHMNPPRIGEHGPREALQKEYNSLLEEYKNLMASDELGDAVFYPIKVYQSDKLGLSLISRDNGKHWEAITLIDLGLGQRDTNFKVEAKDGIPKILSETVPNVRLHIYTKRFFNIDLVPEQPKPEEPEHKPERRVKLPGLTICLSCGFSHMENDKACPQCLLTREQALEVINKKEKKGFLMGIVEALKK